MIERCESAINKLQDTGEIIGVKQVVIVVIKAMREPTEQIKQMATSKPYLLDLWKIMLDAIIGDK